MMGLIRTMGRAPARLLASVVAIALAVGAIGVFAVPGVAAGTLRDLAADDRLAHIAVDITGDIDPDTLELPGVTAIETRHVGMVDTPNHDQLRVVGLDAAAQEINLLRPIEGRLPGTGEVVASDGVAVIGDVITVGGVDLAVVGTGTTAWWSFSDTVYVAPDTAAALVGDDTIRLLLRHADPSEENLDATVESIRSQLGAATFADFPEVVPDGTHPIEADLVQISTMIGLLGIVAGIVALTLLATTSSTLITERTREVAVMRALGSRRRPLRRRLRRLALGVAGAGLVVGIPLGLVVANLVARMVLERFVGVSPDIGWSPVVVAASAVFAIGGAWLVSGRAARRVTKLPLAEALRDRMGDAWGRRLGDRVVSKLRLGGLFERLALRNTLRRRARSVSTVVQVASGVGAVLVVASLATSVTSFNSAELEPWQWETRSITHASGLPLDFSEVEPLGEPAILVWGEVNDWEVEVHGLDPATAAIDTEVEEGRWIDDRPGVVVSRGFADHQGLGLGDQIDVDLASGTTGYEIVGLHRSRSRDVYVARDALAEDLGRSGFVNAVYSLSATAPDLGLSADTTSVAEMSAEDQAARDAIVGIFIAIGGIVAGVTVLGVMSLVAVSLHERRHETATLLAIGGRRADVRRSLITELLPLGVLGAALGVVAGWGGAIGIIAGFEASSAVDIGTDFAQGAVAPAVMGALVVLGMLAMSAARQATRVPAAVVLRGSA